MKGHETEIPSQRTGGAIAVMLQEHQIGRAYVEQMVKALPEGHSKEELEELARSLIRRYGSRSST